MPARGLHPPARTVTGTVRCEGGVLPVVSVRTADEVPKEKVFDVARALGAVTVRAPLHVGDVVLADAAGTGVAVVATKEVAAKRKSSVQGLGKETRERGGEFFAAPLLYGQIVVRYFTCPLKRRVARCAMHSSRHWKIRP